MRTPARPSRAGFVARLNEPWRTMGRRLPCRPRRTLSVLSLLALMGSTGYYASLRHDGGHPPRPAEPHQAPARAASRSSSSELNVIAGHVDGDSNGDEASEEPATSGGSMCLSAPGPVVDISSEKLSKMEQCLAIPPQIVRKPSQALLDSNNAPAHGLSSACPKNGSRPAFTLAC